MSLRWWREQSKKCDVSKVLEEVQVIFKQSLTDGMKVKVIPPLRLLEPPTSSENKEGVEKVLNDVDRSEERRLNNNHIDSLETPGLRCCKFLLV